MKYPNTGLYTYCSELGQNMLKLITPSEKLSFYVPDLKANVFSGQDLYRQRSWHKLWLPYSKDIQLWHTTYQTSDYFPTSPAIKKVLTIHDLNFLYNPNLANRKQAMLSRLQRMIDKSDHLITISNYVKNDVQQHLDIGKKPLSVIYNGCDAQSFNTSGNHKYLPSKPFLFTIGTLLPKKNFHVLPALLENNDFELIIAGNGNASYQKQIMLEAAAYGVSDRIHIIGPVNEEDKYWYFGHCKAFVFPSISEGFGIPVIEAMHHGKPVFLSDKTSLPEIGGKFAYYFENFDPASMQEVFHNGMIHYENTQPAALIKQHADSFRWKDVAKQYLDIYRSLTS
jgi:glycosyltransferase involved in cell wall biosynthesis